MTLENASCNESQPESDVRFNLNSLAVLNGHKPGPCMYDIQSRWKWMRAAAGGQNSGGMGLSWRRSCGREQQANNPEHSSTVRDCRSPTERQQASTNAGSIDWIADRTLGVANPIKKARFKAVPKTTHAPATRKQLDLLYQ